MTSSPPDASSPPAVLDRWRKPRADFLWPHAPGSVEEAGYELVNAGTEVSRERWWEELRQRMGCL